MHASDIRHHRPYTQRERTAPKHLREPLWVDASAAKPQPARAEHPKVRPTSSSWSSNCTWPVSRPSSLVAPSGRSVGPSASSRPELAVTTIVASPASAHAAASPSTVSWAPVSAVAATARTRRMRVPSPMVERRRRSAGWASRMVGSVRSLVARRRRRRLGRGMLASTDAPATSAASLRVPSGWCIRSRSHAIPAPSTTPTAAASFAWSGAVSVASLAAR